MFSDSYPWPCLKVPQLSSKQRCGECEGLTSLQVQTEVEERSVSQGTQQVVAAFKGGH